MARLAGLKTKLARHTIDAKTAGEIIGNGDLVGVITRMERLLDPETVYQILDASACGTSKRALNGIRRIQADTLQERIDAIALLKDFHSDWAVSLGDDSTLTGGWAIAQGDAFACVCSAAVTRKLKVSDLPREGRAMPLTYCLCCAGHCRQHLQRLLDVRLKTREVVSSPINSNGQKPCRFVFEII